MIEILLVLGLPLLGAAFLALVGHRRYAPNVNVGVGLLTLLAAAALTVRVVRDGPLLVLDRQFFVDPFNVFLVALTALVGFTTAIFSRPYMRIEEEHKRVTAARLRLYHSMFQLFNFTMLLALLTNNMGILWVAMEAATLATVLLVSLYRTPASLEAAWKYFILCGVGIAQALFGTILLYFAAEKLLGAEGGALLWTELDRVKAMLEPTVLALAFVFLLVGYGTKVGLVPLHNWLPDAHAEGPTPVSAVLSGLLLNVALYAVVRCKVLVEGSLQTSFANTLMMGFGLLSASPVTGPPRKSATSSVRPALWSYPRSPPEPSASPGGWSSTKPCTSSSPSSPPTPSAPSPAGSCATSATGSSCRSGDARALADGAHAALHGDPQLRATLGANAGARRGRVHARGVGGRHGRQPWRRAAA